MTSSSTEERETGRARRVRLVLVVLIGLAALLAPVLGSSGALFTDDATTGTRITTTPTFP